MTVKRRRGDCGKSDILFSRIVRHRKTCERCGESGVPFDTAHIVGRKWSATRCLEDNAWCLCSPCHHLVDEWAHQFMDLVNLTIGVDRYAELADTAKQGLQVPSKTFWAQTRRALETRCKQLGIPATWKANT